MKKRILSCLVIGLLAMSGFVSHAFAEASRGAVLSNATLSAETQSNSARGLSTHRTEILKQHKDPIVKKDTAMQDKLVHHNHFRYRIDHPANPSGEIIVLLHGSGGDETTLFSFARPIWPRATLVGIRGRLVQDGETRWYRKITPTKFDQKEVVSEADAFVKFLVSLGDGVEYDLSRTTFVGYSNGANLLAVIMMEHPDLVRRAILMRSMPVLDDMPNENLSKTRVLTISGKKDVLYSPFAPALSSLLRASGAKVESHMVEADHMIGQADADIIRQWIGTQNSDRVSINTKPVAR